LPTWYGIVAPANTPSAIIDKLNTAINQALRDPEVGVVLKRGRFILHGGSPADFAALIRRSHDAWGKVIRESGIKGE
jgi:tripartite-type tricarboxylate transporter receptor subunit TctC